MASDRKMKGRGGASQEQETGRHRSKFKRSSKGSGPSSSTFGRSGHHEQYTPTKTNIKGLAGEGNRSTAHSIGSSLVGGTPGATAGESGPFSCFRCRVSFQSRDDLDRHEKRFHGERRENNRS